MNPQHPKPKLRDGGLAPTTQQALPRSPGAVLGSGGIWGLKKDIYIYI